MRIAIIGAKGMLAQDLIPLLKDKHELVLVDLPETDITNKAQIEQALKGVDFVYHLAAYTDVDGAEADRERAYAVNETGTEYVARTCAELAVPLVYISTDYIFGDDSGGRPYTENDDPSPRGVYASSKLAGEKAVQKSCKKYFIVRTAWLYGINGKNFVATMLKISKKQKEIKVVDDQVGSPTYAGHLAQVLVKFLDISEYGVYHLTNQGEVSWYKFACRIFDLAGIKVRVTPCKTADFIRPAPRPAYSVLENQHWQQIGEKPLPRWEEGLAEYLKELKLCN